MWRFLFLAFLVVCTAPVAPIGAMKSRTIAPLLHAHAHNDYQHPRPLLDALEQGFCNIEADVWLVNGELLVAHDREAVNAGRTLQALYLDPLRQQIRRNGGRVFIGGPTCALMIDVKSEAGPAYIALRELLHSYGDILTEFTSSNSTTRALTIILSGNRATETIAAEPGRHVALDGRLADLDSAASPHLVPLISDNWKQHFTWRGEGPLPEAERVKLRAIVQRAHEQGRQIRFWGAPDSFIGWQELRSAGVDLIGTDDLVGLARFLSEDR